MSEVKRLSPVNVDTAAVMREFNNGQYVRFSDYDSLSSQLSALKLKNEKLKKPHRELLQEMKAKIQERGEYKPTDFQIIDSLLNEFDILTELKKVTKERDDAVKALERMTCIQETQIGARCRQGQEVKCIRCDALSKIKGTV